MTRLSWCLFLSGDDSEAKSLTKKRSPVYYRRLRSGRSEGPTTYSCDPLHQATDPYVEREGESPWLCLQTIKKECFE